MIKNIKDDLHTKLISPLNNASADTYPLFCIHPVGGQTIFYNALAKQLENKYQAYGIRAIGLYGEANPLSSVEEMADIYQKNIREIQPHGPYLLLGWSMGGLIALEIAQLFSHQNEQALPILIDTDDPTSTVKVNQMDKEILFNHLNEMESVGVSYVGSEFVSWRVKLSLFLLNYIGLSFQKTAFLMPLFGVKPGEIDFKNFDIYLNKIIHDLSTRDTTQFPIDKFIFFLKNNHLISESIEDKALVSFYEVFRANFYAAENYQPVKFSGNGIYFKASNRSSPIDWKNKISNLDEINCPGTHYNIIKDKIPLNIICNKLRTLPYGNK